MDRKQQYIEAYEASALSIPDELTNTDENYEETSHVFKCMQCDLQIQTDAAFIKDETTGKIDELMRVRVASASAV